MIWRLDREDSMPVPRRASALMTWGDLWERDEHLACTLEDVVREPGVTPRAGLDAWVRAWKVAAETAIPSGVYALALEDSPRFGADTITVLGVPGFDKIRMHGGTDIDSTEGCPIVGSRMDRMAGTIHGANVEQLLYGVVVPPVLPRLKALLKAGIERDGHAYLQVRNGAGWYAHRNLAMPAALP